MTYKEFTEKRQEQVNALPLHYAFGQKQIDEELAKMGCTIDDVVGIGGCGAFCKKEDLPTIKEFFKSDGGLSELMKDETFAVDAFHYEMANHEYCFDHYEGDYNVCSLFVQCKYDEMKTFIEYLTEAGATHLIPFFEKARKAYLKEAEAYT